MNGLSTLWALLSSLWNTNVRGGRVKRLLALVISLFIAGWSLYLMHVWTHITTSKHVFVVDYPMAKIINDSLYIKADLRIKSNEGYTLQQRNGDLYLFERVIRISQLNKIKSKNTSLPIEHNPEFINYALKQDIFVDSPDYINTFPKEDAENLLLIGHYYSSNLTSMITYYPPEKNCSLEDFVDEKGDTIRSYCFRFINNPQIINMPLVDKLHQKLCEDSVRFPSNFFVDWYYIVFRNNIGPFNFSALTHGEMKSFNIWDLFRPYDISKKQYDIYLYSKGVDEIDIKIEANENVEFSSSWNKSVKGNNSITINFTGDHGLKQRYGSSHVELFTKNLESENAQQIRMFIAMTLCSIALGYFFKCIYEYVWILVRKIEKRKRNHDTND